MYFLRVQPLKQQLAHEGLSEPDRFRYLMAWMILVALASVSAVAVSRSTAVLLFVITVAGVVWAWRRNGGRDGHGIFDRYFSIGFVVNLRVMLVMLAVVAVADMIPALRDTMDSTATLFGYFGGGGYEDEAAGQPWTELAGILAEAWIAWSIGRHIGQVRAETAPAYGSGLPAAGAAPPTPTAALIPPTGPSRSVDRLVDRVMQSEIQAGTAVTAPRRKAVKRPGRAAAAQRIKAWRRDHRARPRA